MWTCSNCGRSFKNVNQQHGCRLIQKEQLFEKRPAVFKDIFKKIVSIIKPLGEFREEIVPPDVIYFKIISTFLAVKVKRDHLEVEFFLDHRDDSPLVSKYLQTSAHRFVHVVLVDSMDDIDVQMNNWIKHSYQLILKNKKS